MWGKREGREPETTVTTVAFLVTREGTSIPKTDPTVHVHTGVHRLTANTPTHNERGRCHTHDHRGHVGQITTPNHKLSTTPTCPLIITREVAGGKKSKLHYRDTIRVGSFDKMSTSKTHAEEQAAVPKQSTRVVNELRYYT